MPLTISLAETVYTFIDNFHVGKNFESSWQHKKTFTNLLLIVCILII